MLASFRQTYGSGREELFEIYLRDHRLQELYNLCDLNIFAFHDCQDETIEKFKEINPISNSVYLEYGDIFYPETVKRTKEHLKKLEVSHFLFTQDDTFTAIQNRDVDWKDLIDYARAYNENFMLNFYHKIDILTLEGEDFEGESEERETFTVYKSTTKDFYESEKTPWPMDDSPYICTIDMLDELYDDIYFSYDNIWDAEKFLRSKYSKIEINRFVTNKKMFQNYNLFGKTTYMEVVFRKILKENGLL